MLRVAGGLRGPHSLVSSSCFRSDVLPRASHVNTFTARGNELRVLARHQQQKTQLLGRACRHDRLLTASMGLVSVGIVVTSVLNKQEEGGELKGIIKNLYGDANDAFYRGNGRQFDEPVRNSVVN